MKTYNFEQLIEYIRDWSWADSDMQALTIDEAHSMLANAVSQFTCSEDGFETNCELRQKLQEEQLKQ